MRRIRRSRWLRSAGLFLAALGPGIITGSVDNDAGGITTYSVAGAMYGYGLIWTLIPSFFALVVIQEMNARMGIVTQKGLADLIREHSGVRITFFVFAAMLIADLGNTVTEFAGVAGSMEVFGVPRWISVPIVAVGVWLLVVKGTYRSVERVFLIFSLFLLSYVVSAVLGKPQWGEIGQAIVSPRIDLNFACIAMIISLIGTTIAPWMQFYMQSAVIEKGLTIKDYRFTVLDVVLGCVATVVVAFFIIVACASTLHVNGIQINEAKDAALSLQPLAGRFSAHLFAFGLFIASVFAATILPVATAFYICQAFGFEAGIDRKLSEAPEFYTLYTGMIAVAALIILLPQTPLIKITLWSQTLNGILLPVVLVCMMLLVNNREIMGKHTNGWVKNLIGWSTVVTMAGLSVCLLVFSFLF